MKLESEAHEALSLLFQQDGVPHEIICDNAKEVVLCEFHKKVKDESCYLNQTKLFTPWLNASEKRDKGSEKRFW